MYQKLHILGKVLASVHWNLLYCNLHCDSILYLTSLLSSPAGQTVYECATKGQTLQPGRSKHSRQKQSPRNGKMIPRGAGEAPGQCCWVTTPPAAKLSLYSPPSKAKCTAAALSCRPVQGHSSCACYGAARKAAAKVIGLQQLLFSSNEPAG